MSELERVQAENQALRDQLAVMRQQMDWLKKQLFGRKSERGRAEGQGELELEEEGSGEAPPPPAKGPTPARDARKRVTRAQRLPDHPKSRNPPHRRPHRSKPHHHPSRCRP